MRTALDILADATLDANAKLAEMAKLTDTLQKQARPTTTAELSYAEFQAAWPKELVLTGALPDGTPISLTMVQRAYSSGGFGYGPDGNGKATLGGVKFQIGTWSVVGSKNRADSSEVAAQVLADKAAKAEARKQNG